MKSAEEFADNLKILFGKNQTQDQDQDEADTMGLFKQAIGYSTYEIFVPPS